MSDCVAAGVLVVRGPRVLCFEKFDAKGLSLPCGMVEPGEAPEQTAVREAKEETGFDVVLADHPPFTGFDTVSKKMVRIYRAEIRGGHMHDGAASEGRPCWASAREIAVGPYWHYNSRVLRHFGVKVPLVGKFHSHLTFEAGSTAEAERAAKLSHGKLTIIHLERDGRVQTDYMITHHYETGSRGLEDQTDVEALLRSRGQLLKELGVNVIRLKLEYDATHKSNSPTAADPACAEGYYTEVHVKCVMHSDERPMLTSKAAELGWHPSRNPFATRDDGRLVQFVNRRFYGGVRVADVDAEVDKAMSVFAALTDIEEVKYEVAVYDTNEELDRWWMA